MNAKKIPEEELQSEKPGRPIHLDKNAGLNHVQVGAPFGLR
jgi:hypothetical protein